MAQELKHSKGVRPLGFRVYTLYRDGIS